MSDLLIVSLDCLALIGSVIAIFYSYKSFRETRFISSSWLVFLVAMIFLAAFNLFIALEWVGIESEIMNTLEDAMFPLAIVCLFIVALVTHEEFIKPVTK
jgi:uncharacterized membrane protein